MQQRKEAIDGLERERTFVDRAAARIASPAGPDEPSAIENHRQRVLHTLERNGWADLAVEEVSITPKGKEILLAFDRRRGTNPPSDAPQKRRPGRPSKSAVVADRKGNDTVRGKAHRAVPLLEELLRAEERLREDIEVLMKARGVLESLRQNPGRK